MVDHVEDINGSNIAIHHTLGPGPFEASSGNHSHDGGSSTKIDYADIENPPAIPPIRQSAVNTKLTANVGPTVTTAELLIVTAPVIVGNGVDKFKITASSYCLVGTVLRDVYILRILDGATVIAGFRIVPLDTVAGINSEGITITTTDVPNAGNHSYTVKLARLSGTGVGTISASATTPTEIIVEQIA